MMSIPLFANELPSKTKEPNFKQYNNRIVTFLPFHQSYERIKIKDIYAGVEAFLVGGNKNHVLLNTELRIGYNFFFNRRDHLTPFTGVGYVQDFSYFHHNHFRLRHKPGIAYVALGFLYTHEFSSFFNLGVNGKAMMGDPVSKRHFNWGFPVIGAQFSIPLTFRFGYDKHWDFRLEPFNLYLWGKKASRNYSGGIATFGYRF